MDTVLIIIGVILIIVGIAGCILPFLPGPPLVYGSLILLQFTQKQPFSTDFLVIWALVTTAVLLLDYYIPVWGTKKFGGTKGGTWGATIGLFIGIIFFPPWGMIIGSFVGAYVGELANNQDNSKAFKSAVGSFIGFLAGTVMKLAISIVMAVYFFKNIF